MKMLFGIVFLSTFYISCTKSEFKADYPNTPRGNFEALWTLFDRNYCSFAIKGLDWQEVYNQHSGLVNSGISNDSLLKIFSGMLLKSRDAHVTLNAGPGKFYLYDYAAGKPHNFLGLTIASSGINALAWDNSNAYGIFPENIGYIYVRHWSEKVAVDNMLSQLKNTKALIIDVRDNGGGSDLFTDPFVSRFTLKEFTGSYYRWKSGPGHNEFGPFEPRIIKPGGDYQYTKPIMLLTNRRCYSATEDFILNMKQLPNVRTMGDTTGGGAGNPMPYFLPNGWTLRIPRALAYNINKETFEGTGIAPDIVTYISATDSINRYDRIVKKAIEMLR